MQENRKKRLGRYLAVDKDEYGKVKNLVFRQTEEGAI